MNYTAAITDITQSFERIITLLTMMAALEQHNKTKQKEIHNDHN